MVTTPLKRFPKRLSIATIVVVGLAAPVSAGAADAPPRAQARPPERAIVARDVPRTVPLRKLRRGAARVVARAALSGGTATLGCSSTYSNAWMAIPFSATFGARTGEWVFVRRWLRVWSPTRDTWIWRGDTWHQANPSRFGEWSDTPLQLGPGEWVSGVLETWSESTGRLTIHLPPQRVEPMDFASLAQLYNGWCLPWP